jgi:hypothetical protein
MPLPRGEGEVFYAAAPYKAPALAFGLASRFSLAGAIRAASSSLTCSRNRTISLLSRSISSSASASSSAVDVPSFLGLGGVVAACHLRSTALGWLSLSRSAW